MSYQVLARKWRPQIFVDVVGQQHVLTALANGLSSGRIHHAYLFSGTRGVGKTSIARLLAKGLNCETGITAAPCRQCDNCREIEQGRFVDLLEIDAASRTKVEDTRDLLDNVQYVPVRGRFKVYLIDEVHMLSRHSFNALLKTLEEPPPHVKFLLATTDPQKLPATILSRCLQFHLKALDVEQIRDQLARILHEEQIACEPQALRLLARAADGSLRDALSLTDQAIASGDGQIDVRSVSAMLGTLDDSQALPLVEAMIAANGERVFALINEAASRGAEWEALLVAMLGVLHHIAMIQLSPVASASAEVSAIELRMRELARTLPPTDLQLYYQTLLIGRKELPYAPDRRMGVEMTLLRALAFHPGMPIPAPTASRPPSASAEEITPAGIPALPDSVPYREISLPDVTSQVLAARDQLQRSQREAESKKSEAARVRPLSSAARERVAAVSGRVQARQAPLVPQERGMKTEVYRGRASAPREELNVAVATPGALRKALEDEKTPEMMAKLEQEVMAHDPWATEISRLKLPKMVEQLALNAWKEQNGSSICLHLRSAQRHLNSPDTQKVLAETIGALQGAPVELTIVEDDNLATRTPLEWRQAIYEEKLTQARESINKDNHIQTLRRLFDADLDEESIRPI